MFRKFSGLLDPRIGRGMFNTDHAPYPFMRWPPDHLFHLHHFTIGVIERLAPIGSDRFPLFAELWFTPARRAEQEGLDADRSDRDRARAKANDQGVGASRVPGRSTDFRLIVTAVNLAATTLSYTLALPSPQTNVGVVFANPLNPTF